MYRNILLSVLAAVLIVLAGMPSRPAQARGGNYFGFEQTTKPFVAHASQSMPATIDRVLGDSDCNPALNNRYARLASKLSIHVPPGTGDATWMAASFPAPGGEADSVTVSWSAKLDATGNTCPQCLAVAYAGTQAPQPADFTTLQSSGYLNTVWANYTFSTIVVPEMANSIHVAIGWNGTGSAIDLDCVTVTIVPIGLGK